MRQVDLAVREGEILGLIGPNGSGKTTLFNLVTGFYRPDGGRIRLGERDVTGWPPPRLCKQGIARTFQLVRPFQQLTVRQNVEVGRVYGREPARDRRQAAAQADALLELVGLADLSGRPASSLNLAERRRLEIARALGSRPRLLLLDEAIAGLNPVETTSMLDLIGGLRAGGLGIVLIEHNMGVIMGLSDRVVVLHHGEKLAEGSPEAVSQDPRVVAAYLGQAAAP